MLFDAAGRCHCRAHRLLHSLLFGQAGRVGLQLCALLRLALGGLLRVGPLFVGKPCKIRYGLEEVLPGIAIRHVDVVPARLVLLRPERQKLLLAHGLLLLPERLLLALQALGFVLAAPLILLALACFLLGFGLHCGHRGLQIVVAPRRPRLLVHQAQVGRPEDQGAQLVAPAVEGHAAVEHVLGSVLVALVDDTLGLLPLALLLVLVGVDALADRLLDVCDQ